MAQRLVPQPQRGGSGGGAARSLPHPHGLAARGWGHLMLFLLIHAQIPTRASLLSDNDLIGEDQARSTTHGRGCRLEPNLHCWRVAAAAGGDGSLPLQPVAAACRLLPCMQLRPPRCRDPLGGVRDPWEGRFNLEPAGQVHAATRAGSCRKPACACR